MSTMPGSREVAVCAYACAAVLLGGHVVVKVQAYIVFERLMTGAEFRQPTLVEAPLLWAGVAAAAAALVIQKSVAPRPGRSRWMSPLGRALVLLAAGAIWWALAVAQWWLIVGPWAPPGTVRDPTPLDTFLLVAVCCAALGVAITARSDHRKRQRSIRNSLEAARHGGLAGGAYDSRGVRVTHEAR